MNRRTTLPLLLLFAAAAVAVLGSMRLVGPPASSAHYAFGRGPTIVLVHGLGSRIEDWLPMARLLARKYRVELVQLPGHGESELPAPLTLERAAESLTRSLREISDEPVVLVGHSLGGLVAAQVALDRPDRVRALVLVETALRPPMEPAERRAMLDALARDYDGVIRDAFHSFGRDSAQGERLYLAAAAQDPAMMRAWITLALTADLSDRVPSLRVPTLAVVSDRTWPADERWSQSSRVLGYIGMPALEVERLADSGHFVMLDHPAALARLIERFASRRRSAPLALTSR